MVKNKNEISGKAVSVLVGVILLLIPWFTELGFSTDLLLIIFGTILVYFGVRE